MSISYDNEKCSRALREYKEPDILLPALVLRQEEERCRAGNEDGQEIGARRRASGGGGGSSQLCWQEMMEALLGGGVEQFHLL